MHIKTIWTPNGEILTSTEVYNCDECGTEFDESVPHEKIGENQHFCAECAFIKGFINDKTFLSWCGVHLDTARAVVRDGQVHAILSGKFPWEKNKNADRFTKEYKDWRKSVFEKNHYTCVLCGQVGGKLNAHHIKPYAKHKSLRFDIKNGITLCEKCHRKIHKKEKYNAKLV